MKENAEAYLVTGGALRPQLVVEVQSVANLAGISSFAVLWK